MSESAVREKMILDAIGVEDDPKSFKQLIAMLPSFRIGPEHLKKGALERYLENLIQKGLVFKTRKGYMRLERVMEEFGIWLDAFVERVTHLGLARKVAALYRDPDELRKDAEALWRAGKSFNAAAIIVYDRHAAS